MISKTLSPDNQAAIACPVFRSDVKIASCFQLRDLVWRGERPAVRYGCQVAMDAGKCPIPVIITKMIRMQDDPYHSPEPKRISIQQVVLDQISPVMVPEKRIDESGASDLEKKALHRCNKDARAGSHMTTKSKPYVAPKKVAPPTKMITAAATGDLSAAINTEKAA